MISGRSDYNFSPLQLAKSALGQIAKFLGGLANILSIIGLLATQAQLLILNRRVEQIEKNVRHAEYLATDALWKSEAATRASESAINKANAAIASANTAVIQSNGATIRADIATTRANQAINEASDARQEANQARDEANYATTVANTARSEANTATVKANTAVADSNQAKREANTATTKANNAIAKSNTNAQELANLRTETGQLRRQNELLKSDVNSLRVALTTALTKVEEKEDKYIVRRTEKAIITNASGIRDLKGNLEGLQSKFSSAADSITKTVTQTIEGKTKENADLIKTLGGGGGISVQGAKDAVFGDLFGNTKANGQLKDVIGTEVSTQTKALEKVNTEQYSDLKDRIDGIPEVVTGAVAVGMVTTLKPFEGIWKQTAAQTAPAAQAQAAAAGVCSTTAPGGCMNKNIMQPLNNRIGDVINAAGTAAAVANNALLMRMSGVLNAIKATTDTIKDVTNTTLGVIKHGTYGLEAIQRFASTAWKATHADKVLNTLSVVIALHNAAMLSRNLGETLGGLTSQALATIGIKDSEGSPLNINAAIGNSVNAMLTNILGAETYQGIKETWNKSSRILSSASQIVWTVRSIADSTREITEWTAENTGKIGNALKRWRVVGENAYSWMPERMTATNKWLARVERTRNGIDSLDDAASSFSSVLGEAQNIQSEYTELQEQGTKFKDNVKALEPKVEEPNEPVQLAREEEREASKSPSSQADVFRGEGEQE